MLGIHEKGSKEKYIDIYYFIVKHPSKCIKINHNIVLRTRRVKYSIIEKEHVNKTIWYGIILVNNIESIIVVQIDTCTIEVDSNENILVLMLVRSQKRLLAHLKSRKEKLVTCITEFLTFMSVVKTSDNQRTSASAHHWIKN